MLVFDSSEDRKMIDNRVYTVGTIDPWHYIIANDLNFFEGNVVKYITRWRRGGGEGGVADLRKAVIYLEQMIRQSEESEDARRE